LCIDVNIYMYFNNARVLVRCSEHRAIFSRR